MKIKFRKIENTSWIKNFFILDDVVYLTDSDISNPLNLLCKIDLKKLEENLKIKGNLNRAFLAHPNPIISNLKLSTQTDVEIIYKTNLYIQNFIVAEDIAYISFVKENRVYTSVFKDDLELQEFQILTKLNNSHLVIKKNEKILIVDKNLNLVKETDLNINGLVEFKEVYVAQETGEKIAVYNKNFEFINYLDEDQTFKKIFYLNKNNLLISHRNTNKTTLVNIIDGKQLDFDDAFFYRAQLMGENLLLVKKNDKYQKEDLLNFVY